MERIWDALTQWLGRIGAPEHCLDIIDRMSPRERADLPSCHPRHEPMQPRDTQRC